MVVRRETVGFESADPSRTGQLTCGQRYIWDIIADLSPHDAHLNLQVNLTLPERGTARSAIGAVRVIIETHESLRTSYRTGEDGEPVQATRVRGSFPVDLVTVDGGWARERAEQTAANLRRDRFDLEAELPVRAAIVGADGAPRHLVLVLSHLTCDGWGKEILAGQLHQLLAGADPATVFPARLWHPLDQRAYEESPEGRAAGEQALRFIGDRLARFPTRLFARERFAPLPERYWEGRLTSPAIAPAAAVLAEKLGVSAAAILTAAAARALHETAGVDVFGFAMRTFNRYHPPAREAVGHYAEDIPVLVGRLGRPLAEVAAEVQRELRNTMRCTHFWPPDLRRITAALSAQRGVDFVVDAAVNYANPTHDGERAESTPDITALREGARAAVFDWTMRRRFEKIQFLFTSTADDIRLLADTAYLSPEEIERLLRAVRSELVEGAVRSVGLVGGR